MRRPTSAEAASLSVPQLLRRVRDSPYYSLERPATPAQIEVGAAAWQEWFGTPMPGVYRELLAISNGLNVNGLYLFAASEYTVVEDGVERWMPGLAAENEGYLHGLADTESRRFFGSADDDLYAYDTRTAGWLVVDRVNWSGDAMLEFASCADLLIDRLFCCLDEAGDYPDV